MDLRAKGPGLAQRCSVSFVKLNTECEINPGKSTVAPDTLYHEHSIHFYAAYLCCSTYQDDSKKSPTSSYAKSRRGVFEMASHNFRVISLQCCLNNQKGLLYTHVILLESLPWIKGSELLNLHSLLEKQRLAGLGNQQPTECIVPTKPFCPDFLPVLQAYGVWLVARPQFWQQLASEGCARLTSPWWYHSWVASLNRLMSKPAHSSNLLGLLAKIIGQHSARD